MGDMADYYRDLELEACGSIEACEELNDLINVRNSVILHKSKDGQIKTVRLEDAVKSKYPLMDNNHLLNTIRFILRKTKNGISTYEVIGCVADIDSFDVNEAHLSKKKARKMLGLKHYKKEAKKRGITWKQEKILL